jgi:hypothetical protein
MSPSVNPKLGMSLFDHVRTFSTSTHILYVQLAVYVSYYVPHRGSMCHVYVSTPLTHILSYPSQLIRAHEIVMVLLTVSRIID